MGNPGPPLDLVARIDAVELVMRPIGVVRSPRDEAIDDGWDLVDASIQLDPDVVDLDAVRGLAEFSHVEVVFAFDRVDPDAVHRGARRPRGNPDWPEVGILAQRAKDRPNRIGTTVCELLKVRPWGELGVRGLDAIDGTPVLDIKPWFRELAPRGDVRQPPWVGELMAEYWAPATPDAPPARLSDDQAAAWRDEIRRSPAEVGTLELIVARPAVDERTVLDVGRLDTAVGLVGDDWATRGAPTTPDGSADPDAQLNVMNIRVARLVAGSDDGERIALAGDQLYVDLDLSPANLPPGTRLAVGDAVIEVTAKPHTGCAKFTRRFGLAAHRWINGNEGRAASLRGICAKVVEAGEIRPGDVVRKLP